MTDHKIRSGSLQFWPRKRARRILHSVNWENVKSGNNFKGFIGYKVAMASVFVKDNTEHSMTKAKRIIIPATIIECPTMKIYAVRFYKNKKVVKDFIVGYEDKLKDKIKKPKEIKKIDVFDKIFFEYDDVRAIAYSNVKLTGIGKKNPDLIELDVSGSNKEEKLNFIKERIGKEIQLKDVFSKGLVDVRGVTKGYGTQGPVRRFGITLKAHKSEKGVRRPGSLGPWHPARVTFRTPMAGQTGYHHRIVYNNLILQIGDDVEKTDLKNDFHKYGNIKNSFIVLKGSVQGPKKRALLLTHAMRPTKKQVKQNYEVIGFR